MAGTILADDIQHSTAGSVGTEYVVEGSPKAWVNFNGQGTIAARDSLNNSSLTDNGSGDYSVNFSNSFSNTGYTNTGSINELDTTAATSVFFMEGGNQTFANSHTTSYNRITPQSGTGKYDCVGVYALNIGDLA
jgi:hypothetical protein